VLLAKGAQTGGAVRVAIGAGVEERESLAAAGGVGTRASCRDGRRPGGGVGEVESEAELERGFVRAPGGQLAAREVGDRRHKGALLEAAARVRRR
jgi:hypothetical protein